MAKRKNPSKPKTPPKPSKTLHPCFWKDNPPDFVNEKGVKWWLDRELSSVAADKGFPKYRVYVVEEKDGNITRLLIDDQNDPIWETQSYEGMCMHLDLLRFARES